MRSRRGPERSETSGSRGRAPGPPPAGPYQSRPTQRGPSRSGSEPWKAGRTRPPQPPPPPAPDVRFGVHAVEEALRAGNVRRVFLERGYESRPRLAAIAEQAFSAGVDVVELDAQALALRARSDRHQGAMAEARPFRYLGLDELIDHATGQDEAPFLLIVDGVEDPHNLGAILRSADAAGVHGVIVPERRVAPVTPVVARASAGAVDHVRLAQVGNLTRALETLKAQGIWVYGLEMDGEQEYDAPDYTGPVALVVGAEGRGIGRLVREHCDVVVRIPLAGHVESLNVSVATSLALFAVRRDRHRRAI